MLLLRLLYPFTLSPKQEPEFYGLTLRSLDDHRPRPLFYFHPTVYAGGQVDRAKRGQNYWTVTYCRRNPCTTCVRVVELRMRSTFRVHFSNFMA